ncbi:hypothetical protein Bwad006_03140 [Bilophila wadsworthia]
MMSLSTKNFNRRYGTCCAQCGKELGKYRLDGRINGHSLSFCSFACHDTYIDKQKAAVCLTSDVSEKKDGCHEHNPYA